MASPKAEHRKRLPRKRESQTYSFSIQGVEGYMHVGFYPDQTPGEMFLRVSKNGSTLAGFADSFSIAVSMALQHGAPLETLCDKFINMQFEPSGNTDDEDIPKAKSIMDYLFRRVAMDFLTPEAQQRLGLVTQLVPIA